MAAENPKGKISQSATNNINEPYSSTGPSDSTPPLPHPYPEEEGEEEEQDDNDNVPLLLPEREIYNEEDTTATNNRRRRTIVAVLLAIAAIIITIAIFNTWLIPLFRPRPPPPPPPRVDLNYTVYEGERLPEGINRFLGMRYAAPPVGERRWRAPVEPFDERRGGKGVVGAVVEKATRFRPKCLGLGRIYPFGDEDEDCLFVNVWAPSDAGPESRLPVWVFISGGGYNSLTNANWNGAGVVEKSGNKIVMVNFNYRVGMWGFLASERVREDGDLNVGLLDQRMLLKWVKSHVSKFGGDPDHVVIHGASAGAGSVAMHMIAYGGRNDQLFVGAMAESVFFPAQPRLSELEYQFDRLVRQTGCDQAAPAKQLSCLRLQDVRLLQEANRAQPFPGRPDPPGPLFYWTPCIDGDLIPDLPYRLFEEGRFVDVPLLSGTASDEGSVFAINAASPADMARFFANNYPHLTPRETDLIIQQYPKLAARPRHNEWYPATSQAYGEATFICPNVNILDALSRGARSTTPSSRTSITTVLNKPLPPRSRRQQAPKSSSIFIHTRINNTHTTPRIFAYRYDVQDADNTAMGIGVPHLFDAPAIFGPGNCPTPRSYWSYNAAVVPVFMAYWISFARTLDPNTHRREGSPEWKAWDGGDDGGGRRRSRLLVQTGDTRMEEVSEAEGRRCEFWLGLGDVLEQI